MQYGSLKSETLIYNMLACANAECICVCTLVIVLMLKVANYPSVMRNNDTMKDNPSTIKRSKGFFYLTAPNNHLIFNRLIDFI